MENLGKRTRTAYASNTNRIQETEERISSTEDTIDEMVHQSKKMANAKSS
jgi:TolA-binding protein